MSAVNLTRTHNFGIDESTIGVVQKIKHNLSNSLSHFSHRKIGWIGDNYEAAAMNVARV